MVRSHLNNAVSTAVDREITKLLCTHSFYEFVKEFWDVIIAEPPAWNWHIKYICDEIEVILRRLAAREEKAYDYYIFNVPPGESKTTICTIFSTVWGWVIDPSLRYICSTYAETLSELSADKVVTILESNKFKSFFPHIKVIGGKSNLRTESNGQRYITATKGTVTGVHAHLKIVDDPINVLLAASTIERVKANTFVSESLSTRNVDTKVSTTLIVMQRLHENDTSGFLLAKKGLRIKHICLPAELTDDVRPIELRTFYENGLMNPMRTTHQSLNNDKIDLGSYGYAGQKLQRPSPAEGGILKKHWFEIVDRAIPLTAVVKFKLDTAYTEDKANDPTGFFAYFMEGGIMYVVNAESQYLEFPELKKYIPNYCRLHGYSHRSTVKVEPKASGKSIVQELKKIENINILDDRAPKDDKVTRANGISAICESGKVKLLRGAWNSDFLDQLAAFPNAMHDEHVDNLTSAVTEELIQNSTFYGFKRAN